MPSAAGAARLGAAGLQRLREQAFEMGREARRTGSPASANPYAGRDDTVRTSATDMAAAAWELGWSTENRRAARAAPPPPPSRSTPPAAAELDLLGAPAPSPALSDARPIPSAPSTRSAAELARAYRERYPASVAEAGAPAVPDLDAFDTGCNTPEEAAGVAQLLRAALLSQEGAAERWRERAARGAGDGELERAIRRELGPGPVGGSTAAGSYRCPGGQFLTISMFVLAGARTLHLRSVRLLAWTRFLFAIPVPRGDQ